MVDLIWDIPYHKSEIVMRVHMVMNNNNYFGYHVWFVSVMLQIRRLIGDFGVPIAIFLMIVVDISIQDVYTQVNVSALLKIFSIMQNV